MKTTLLKKTILTLILFLVCGFYMYTQEEMFSRCCLLESAPTNYYPDAYAGNADMSFKGNKIVRVNIIYEYGSNLVDSIDNFIDRRTENGYITGYEYAEEVLARANQRLGFNHEMKIPSGNNIPVLPTRYRLSLAGVFYEKPGVPLNDLIKSRGKCINIYMSHITKGKLGDSTVGEANMHGDHRNVHLWGAFARYKFDEQCLKNGDPEVYGLGVRAWGVVHETGHSLSLCHTILEPGGNPDKKGLKNDYCDDTITFPEAVENALAHCGHANPTGYDSKESDPCKSNNTMDYGTTYGVVFTPQQINRVHYALQTLMSDYVSTAFDKEEIIISSPLQEPYNSLMARKIKIDKNTSIELAEGENLFINCEDFELNGAIDIPKGAVFQVNTAGYQHNIY